MSTLTPVVLGCDRSTETTRQPSSRTRWIILETGDMRGTNGLDGDLVGALDEHVFIRFISIAKCSWRGAARRPNGRELNERPVSGAAPANRAFKQTDAGYSRARRAPDILRRSLTPVR